MADVIVSSILIRLRHPIHEAGKTNQFDATTQEWITDSDGHTIALPEKGPFTPQQLADKGLTLPVILNQAVQTAIADRAAALADAMGLTDKLEAKQAELDAANARIRELESGLSASFAVLEAKSEAVASKAKEG